MKAKEAYRIVGRGEALDESQLAELLADQGQLLLPVLDLIVNGRMMIDGIVDQIGRSALQAILELSTRELADSPLRSQRPTSRARSEGVYRLLAMRSSHSKEESSPPSPAATTPKGSAVGRTVTSVARFGVPKGGFSTAC